MISRRLLYLDTQRMTAYAWRQGKLQPEGVFEMRPDDHSRFGDYLRAHQKSHFQLLANVAEEGHEQETIPFLQGADRKALITRKLGQHFLGSPLATAVSLGYEKNKRKNEKLLLSALTNPGHFEPWIKAMQEAAAPLAGIYTVAQLGGGLLKKLGKTESRAMLLTYQDHSIRESYLLNGQPLFSRMVPLFDSSIAGIASRLAAESTKLHQYLAAQRLIRRSEPISVFILAHPQAVATVRQACVDTTSLHFQILDSHLAARQLDLKTLPNDSSSELLFLHLLATAPPRQQFAAENFRHDYRISQLRYGLIGLSIVALLGGALFVTKQLYGIYSQRQETQALNASESDLSWRYREISATFPQLGIDNDTLRHVTNRQSELLKQQRTPDEAYRRVSKAISEMPNVHLETLEWKLSGETNEGNVSAREKVADLLKADHEIIILRGTIRLGPASTARQTLATFEHFIDLLRVDRDSDVSVLQQPFEIESGRALRGGDVENESSQARQFTVKISRKLPT